MVDNISLRKGTTISLLITFSLIYLIFSCAPAPIKRKVTEVVEEEPAKIESINVISGPYDKESTIEITSSKQVPYAAFKLIQPLRLIVGINALPAKRLTRPVVINGRIIKDIHFEIIDDKPISTRVIATLSQDVEYNVQEKDRTIKILLSPKKSDEKREKQVLAAREVEIGPKEPRLFFSPGKTKLNQILGVDFFILPKGKSRVTITTSKKAEYELSRKNTLTLLLNIKEATIIPELTRYIDSSRFEGVVSRITPIVKAAERGVDLEIGLKEMVPYHLIQTDTEIRLDFSKTSVKPPAKKITPAILVKAPLKPEEVAPEVKPVVSPPPTEAPVKPEEVAREVKPAAAPPPVEVAREVKPAAVSPPPPRPPVKRYTGARMTMDFANADIRNILKLIGEVSQLNIVWGPEVKGTVSMRLKNVPWDQALDVVLEASNLGLRREGNIIWVTTKEKVKQLEKEEEAKQEAERKAEQERLKEIAAEQERAKALEPLITAYIPVDFADADAGIKPHVESIKSERGIVIVDKRTNTIIMTDTASIIEKAKKLVKEFDAPVKQIMIEARIVEASTTFMRDLGVRWNSIGRRWQTRVGMGWGTDPTAFAQSGDIYTGGSFSSNAPTADWSPNIGISFAQLTDSGLGTLTLDASLALAEAEGSIKVVSAPKVIASNNETATISRGSTFYLPAADNVPPKEVQAKLSLKVKPTVSVSDYVTMEVSVLDETQTGTGKTGKDINTKLIVRSGDTIVIGGIYTERKKEDEAGIPGLSKIPFLGWLFKGKSKASDRSELLIFLTPTVLPPLRRAS